MVGGTQRSRTGGTKYPALAFVAGRDIIGLANHVVVRIFAPINVLSFPGAGVDADDVQVQIDDISVWLT